MKVQTQTHSDNNLAQPNIGLKLDATNNSSIKSISPESNDPSSCCLVSIISSIWSAFTTFIEYVFGCCPEENVDKNLKSKVEEKPKSVEPPPQQLPSSKGSNLPIIQKTASGFVAPAPRALFTPHMVELSPRAAALGQRNLHMKHLKELKSIFLRKNVFEMPVAPRRHSLITLAEGPSKREAILAAVKRRDSFSQREPVLDPTIVDPKTGNTFLHYLVQNEGTVFTDCNFTCTTEHIKVFLIEYPKTKVDTRNNEGKIPLNFSQSSETTTILKNLQV